MEIYDLIKKLVYKKTQDRIKKYYTTEDTTGLNINEGGPFWAPLMDTTFRLIGCFWFVVLVLD